VSYEHVIRAAGRLPWAIMPEKAEEIAALLSLKAAGGSVPAEVRAQLAAEHRPRIAGEQGHSYLMPDRPDIELAEGTGPAGGSQGGNIAVIPVYGLISQRASMMSEMSGGGGTSIQKLTQAFRQAVADPNIAAIVLDVDSPGGSVFGVQELADEIRRARAQKPIVANFNSLGASAAYWIGSAASEAVVTPGGQVGSIGVLALHVDESARIEQEGFKPTLITAGKYKAEIRPEFPLSDEARDFVQGQVDEYYAAFVDAVAVGRGVSRAAVREGYGQGRVLLAKPALAAGMVDRIETLDQTIARLMKPQGRAALTKRGAAAEAFEVITLPVEDVVFMNERDRVIRSIVGSQGLAGVDVSYDEAAEALAEVEAEESSPLEARPVAEDRNDAATVATSDGSPVATVERDGSLGTIETPLPNPPPQGGRGQGSDIEVRMRRLKL
jgi:signal peptide peptidase SppA